MQTNAKARASKAKALESVAPVAILPAPPAEIILPESLAPVAETAATESKPNAADKRAAYIADYATAKAVYAILCAGTGANPDNCPIKPAIGFKCKPLMPKSYSLSPRGANALYMLILCNGKPVADGQTYSRRFTMQSREFLTENGCFSDFDGTAYTVDHSGGLGHETLTLKPGAAAAILGHIGKAKIQAVRDLLAHA